MPTTQHNFEDLRAEYAQLWAVVELRQSKMPDIDATARRIMANKPRYALVQQAVGVPWFVVGIIHAMECGLDFSQHLHCGDPLTARTYHVPKGRPVAPPANGKCYTWMESAIDALTMKKLQDIRFWGIERICYELERYNGWGYRTYHPGTLSPYLWSGTNHYARGKYVADGQWSSTAVSGQSGAIALLKQLMRLDSSIVVPESEAAPEVPSDAPLSAEAFPKAEPQPVTAVAALKTANGSRSIWAALSGIASLVAGVLTDYAQRAWDWLTWAVDIVPKVKQEVDDVLAPAQEMAAWFGANLANIALTMSAICAAVFLWRHLQLKLEVAATKTPE